MGQEDGGGVVSMRVVLAGVAMILVLFMVFRVLVVIVLPMVLLG